MYLFEEQIENAPICWFTTQVDISKSPELNLDPSCECQEPTTQLLEPLLLPTTIFISKKLDQGTVSTPGTLIVGCGSPSHHLANLPPRNCSFS